MLRSLTTDLIWTTDAEILCGGKSAYYADLDVIAMREGLTQVQRRCSLAHELAHLRRQDRPTGNGHYDLRQEAAADLWAARYLIDVRALGEALAWSRHAAEIAEELWVTQHLLRVRLENTPPSERHYLRRRLASLYPDPIDPT